ncbi:hypothetical protein GF312_21235 [Candidatus Poribacteria bacterium]|nr:hypothetical protein [Candidatus Poribacteria bacterium]
MSKAIIQAKLKRINEKISESCAKIHKLEKEIDILENAADDSMRGKIPAKELYKELTELEDYVDSLNYRRKELQREIEDIERSEFLRHHNAATTRLYEKARRYNHLASQVIALAGEIEQEINNLDEDKARIFSQDMKLNRFHKIPVCNTEPISSAKEILLEIDESFNQINKLDYDNATIP